MQQADAARMSGWVWLQRRLALRSSGGAEFERFSTAGFGPASQVQPRCSAGFCSDIFFDMTFSAVLTVRREERSLRLEKLRAGRLTRQRRKSTYNVGLRVGDCRRREGRLEEGGRRLEEKGQAIGGGGTGNFAKAGARPDGGTGPQPWQN